MRFRKRLSAAKKIFIIKTLIKTKTLVANKSVTFVDFKKNIQFRRLGYSDKSQEAFGIGDNMKSLI